ncbi:glutathione S-transferase N-terminal domain-containing protein [Pseudomonas sp.]|uniref:glutathione S-transferase N-terminal domain-containing protein n=1 Tax=Pseudomonas sp. TaxID=306 RepID=UPI00289861CC|nr:glutathione S-transferase N-terminal domain-containing protein [Pseudomonas sp.]
MIELYGMGSPNVLKVVLMLEELQLAYRFKHVHVWKGEQFTDTFKALNPNSKVPVLIDPDGPSGEPYRVFESGAILQYLAEKTGKFLPANGTARYDVMQWLMIQLAGVGPMFGQYVHFTRFEPEVSQYARSRYTTEALRLVELIDQRLATHSYLGGDTYSIADIATYPWMAILEFLGLPHERYTHLTRWLGEISKRPAAIRLVEMTKEIQAEGVASRSEATPDDYDRMFGRGQYARSL